MRTLVMLSLLAAGGAHAADEKVTKDVKLNGSKAKIEFSSLAAEGHSSGPTRNPRVGIAPLGNAGFAAALAKALDDAGKTSVVPASQLGSVTSLAPMSSMMRSELRDLVSGTCKRGKLDYVFMMYTGQPSIKAGFGASFGLGRLRWRSQQEAQLFDCRTQQGVWHQFILLETSKSVFGMSMSGTAAGLTGSPEADRAMAAVIAEKLTGDMGW